MVVEIPRHAERECSSNWCYIFTVYYLFLLVKYFLVLIIPIHFFSWGLLKTTY